MIKQPLAALRSIQSQGATLWQPSIAAIRQACYFLLITCGMLLLVGFMFPAGGTIRLIGAACMLVVCAVCMVLLSENQARKAVQALLAGTWLTASALTVNTGGIDSVILAIYPPLICLTGWIFGVRSAVVLSAISIIWTLMLAVSQLFGYLPAPIQTPGLLRWLFTSVVLLFSLFAITYLIHFYERRIRSLRDLDAALAQSESMFRSLTEMVPVGIFRADKEGNCIFVNPRYCEITGRSFKQSLGKGWWSAVVPDDRHQLGKSWQLLIEQGTAFSAEYRLLRPDTTITWVYSQAQSQLSPSGELIGFVCSITDITQNKAAESEIQQLAFYDSLTGLPNRLLLMDRLKHAATGSARTENGGALFFLDLDNFKTLNDTLGHDKGDLLLQQVAQRMRGCVREGDTVARLGGDEFVVVLENLSQYPKEAGRQAEAIGEKILASLNQPYQLAGVTHHSTASIGITMFNYPLDSVDEMMKRADMAMYQSKASGRNTVCFFDPEMQAVIAARVSLEASLRNGLQEKQFLLHYQPQVNSSGRITGAEAFVRWQCPERGMVPPASFIPLAEETGLIVPIDFWVLTTACQQLARWALHPKTSHLSMSVKVSAHQFRQRNFVEQVTQILDQSQAHSNLLKLELKESLLLTDVDDIIEKTNALSKRGVGFSLADLGTGYSSLLHLKQLSLDQLRIDQSFVRGLLTNPNAASVTRSIFALAESLGVTVSAEGVETLEERDALAAFGCHAYQGYFFSQTLPADEFERLL